MGTSKWGAPLFAPAGRRLGLLTQVALALMAVVLLGGPALARGLTIAVNSPTTTFDPSIGNSVPHQRLLTAAYETLLAIDPDTSEVIPWLATEWSVNDDKSEYTLRLREGVLFHDGTPFDAEAVKASLERTLSIGQGESYLISSLREVQVVSPYEVRLVLDSPQPEFLYALTRMFMISPTAIRERPAEWFATNEAGTGPYRLVEWVQDQRYVFEQFPEYWRGWEGPHLDSVTFRVVVEPATQRLLLESGEVDVAENIVLDDLPALELNPAITVARSSAPRPFYISFNVNRPPLDDVRVRKAIALALDYDAAIEIALAGYGSPMRGPVPVQFPGFNEDIEPQQQDLEEARRLLAEAGYPEGGFSLTFLYLEHWLFERTVGLLLQDALAGLGVELVVEGQPWATMTARMDDPEQSPDLVMFAQSTATPSALSILEPMYRTGSEHWSHFWYSNPDVDRLLAEAATEADDVRRHGLYAQIQALIVEDQPQMFVFSQDEVMTLRSNVRGYKPQFTWSKILNYYDIYVE